MFFKRIMVLGALLSLSAPTFAKAEPSLLSLFFQSEKRELSLEEWTPKKGDRLVIDTQSNVGYLVHTDRRFTQFDVVTGQKRFVCYIGLCYKAATPVADWSVESSHIKGDRTTYGESGKFLRLYRKGESTHYGIHTYRNEEEMFATDGRFGSMGCVIVRTPVMDLLESTFLRFGSLQVKTREGVEDPGEV